MTVRMEKYKRKLLAQLTAPELEQFKLDIDDVLAQPPITPEP